MTPVLLFLLAGQVVTATPALPDQELAKQRGGFRLPSGVDVALTVQTQTAVDGALVLRTVFRADQGTPSLTVYTPKPGTVVTVQGGTAPTAGGGGAANPSVSYDQRNGIQVTPGAALPTVTVTSGHGAAETADSPDLQAIDASGAGVATAAGQVTAARTGGVDTVQLKAADLTITHLAGNAFGSAIVNSGNDRAIDTQTSVSIDLSNAGAEAASSAMLRAMDLAIDATAMRAQ